MTRTFLVISTFAILTVGSSATRSDLPAATASPQTPSAQAQTQKPQPGMDMMKMHEQMMAEMKAADAKLDALVTAMNAATGNAKVDATAAVVTELVRQQKAMHEHMSQMAQHMMGGMMKK